MNDQFESSTVKKSANLSFFLVVIADPIIQLKVAVISFAGLIGVAFVDFSIANDIIRLNDPWDITKVNNISENSPICFQWHALTYQWCSSLISSRSCPNFHPYSCRWEIIRWSQGNTGIEQRIWFEKVNGNANTINSIIDCVILYFIYPLVI